MVHDVAVAVDRGLLEPDDVDEEADERAGVAGAQRGPDLGCRGVVRHADQSRPPGVPFAWTFPNSSASHLVGDRPLNATKSRTRWDWSA